MANDPDSAKPPAIWEGPPTAGSVWRVRYGSRQITRHVLDRTFDGDVIFVEGRYTRFAQRCQCSLAEWNSRKWKEVS